MAEFAANFSLNNNSIDAQFDLSEGAQFDALFQLEAALDVIGKGLINVTKSQGVATVTSITYIHEQGISSDTWTIEHNLNKFPSVTLVDTAGTQFQGRVEYIDENNCIVYMNGATKGKAYLN